MNAELFAADAAADPILASAKIVTIKFDGKDVAASDAPLPARITAIGALLASGDRSHDEAELIAGNGVLAAQVEDLEGKLTVATATAGAQVQKISKLETDLATARASVDSLTSSSAATANLLEASNKEVTRLMTQLNSQQKAVATECVALSCLTLVGDDGRPIAKDSTQAQKVDSAMKQQFTALLSSLVGSLNSAAARIGIVLKEIPSGGAANAAPAKPKSIDEEVRQRKALAKNPPVGAV